MITSEAYGPVPSRRLGRSLGINHIPPKFCTYSCVYCQLGRTDQMVGKRRTFFTPEEVAGAVATRVGNARQTGETIDYLAFVPDGEPTLDTNLGCTIEALRPLGIPVAIITNCSLIWRWDVRQDLAKADWVSLKVDTVDESVWTRLDRPHGELRLPLIIEGIVEFARMFKGSLATETMLIDGLNDGEESVRAVADFIFRIHPSSAYLSVPTRPPAEAWVHPPAAERLNRAYQILAEGQSRVECLTGYEGNAFASTGNFEEDLLNTTAVHPMRREAVLELTERTGTDWSMVENLVRQGKLVKTDYRGATYYARQLRHPHPTPPTCGE